MRILITGGGGFIGTHLVKALKEQGHGVEGVDCFDPQVHGDVGPSTLAFERVAKTYDDLTWLRVRDLDHNDLRGIDIVYHLAAKVGVGQSMYQIKEYVDFNVSDTAHLLSLLKGSSVKRLIVASSMSVYGEMDRDPGMCDPSPASETTEVNPPNIYALTKLDQERMSLIYGEAHGIETVALRFFNCFGIGQSLNNPYTGVLAIFASQLLNGQRPQVFDDGQQTRDFVHVSDIVRGLLLAQKIPSGVYNVGTGVKTSVKRVAELLCDHLNPRITPEITGKTRVGDIRHCYADITKIKSHGYVASDFEPSIQQYCAWLKSQKADCKVAQATKELEQNGLLK